MVQKIARVGVVLLLITGAALLADRLGGPAASSAVVVIAGTLITMFYVPSWGYGQPSEQDRVRERLVQNAKLAPPAEEDARDQQDLDE
jgi:hypothetical protein